MHTYIYACIYIMYICHIYNIYTYIINIRACIYKYIFSMSMTLFICKSFINCDIYVYEYVYSTCTYLFVYIKQRYIYTYIYICICICIYLLYMHRISSLWIQFSYIINAIMWWFGIFMYLLPELASTSLLFLLLLQSHTSSQKKTCFGLDVSETQLSVIGLIGFAYHSRLLKYLWMLSFSSS